MHRAKRMDCCCRRRIVASRFSTTAGKSAHEAFIWSWKLRLSRPSPLLNNIHPSSSPPSAGATTPSGGGKKRSVLVARCGVAPRQSRNDERAHYPPRQSPAHPPARASARRSGQHRPGAGLLLDVPALPFPPVRCLLRAR